MRLALVTNIPSPYRVHYFARLAAALEAEGGALRVLFMRRTKPHRAWNPDVATFPFDATVLPGVHPRAAGAWFHVNPSVGRELTAFAPDVLVVGGYVAPTAWQARRWARSRGVPHLLWFETNPDSSRIGGRADTLRRRLVRDWSGWIAPGERSWDWLDGLAVEGGVRITVPNSIDETRVRGIGSGDGSRTWLAAARLAPAKGLAEFLEMARLPDGVRLVIAGDGPERQRLGDIVRTRRLPVDFVGHLDEAGLDAWYAKAEAFVLPSLRDPSPIVLIEALAAGLPLLVSNRCGNHPQAVGPANGVVFDPTGPAAVQEAVDDFNRRLLSSRDDMRSASRRRYDTIFSTERLVRTLLDGVRRVAESTPGARA